MNMNLQETYNFKPLQAIGVDQEESRLYKCPSCDNTIRVRKDVFYGRCPICKLTIIDYKPLDHQKEFHKSGAMYRLLMGG